MERINKILIIVIVVFLAILGVISGFILQGNFSNDTQNLSNNSSSQNNTTVTNQTNTAVNNSDDNQTTEPGYISRSRAIEIAKQAAAIYPGNETKFTAVLEENKNPPYWHVVAWDNNPESPSYNHAIGGAYINAITGEVISANG